MPLALYRRQVSFSLATARRLGSVGSKGNAKLQQNKTVQDSGSDSAFRRYDMDKQKFSEFSCSILELEKLAHQLKLKAVATLLKDAFKACCDAQSYAHGNHSNDTETSSDGAGSDRFVKTIAPLADAHDALSRVREHLLSQGPRSQMHPQDDVSGTCKCIDHLSDALIEIALTAANINSGSLEEVSSKTRILLDHLPKCSTELADQLMVSICQDIKHLEVS